jgi:hypothetical protein
MITILTQREIQTGLVAGFLFTVFAIVIGMQTFQNYQAGFMYWVQSEKIYRNQNPIKFFILFVLNSIATLVFISVAIYAFVA